jgi:diaminohydroxyphosphoribosylaminopyrimidine deaminase/5-amino-6-(5-phosphoribosylamino)uracil reductase
MDDHDYMDMALDLALKGQGFTSPNPMVGAVVVKNGKVVGTGYHQAAGKPHAEVNALNDAGGDANGATLYVNLEPCNHTGRTPPCTDKILNSGVQRVVVAMRDPNTDVKGGGIDFLKENGINISLGICEAKAKRLNEIFVKYIRTKRPFVILKCAATLDGRIATRTGDSRWVTNEQSRGVVHRLRHAVDAILVGINTINAHGRGKDAIRVVLDTNLSISPDAKVLRLNSDSDTILVAGRSAIQEKKSALAANGIRVIESVLKNKRIDLDLLMDQLGALGITSLLIEGGSRVIASALNAGVVDKIMFFYAPKLTGGDDGVPICRGKGPDRMADCIAVKDVTLQRFGDDVMIEGYIENA